MPDKMMRNAALGDDGTAKAIRSTNDGALKTKQVGALSKSKTAFNYKAIPGSSSVILAEVKNECVIQDIKGKFDISNKSVHMQLEIYTGSGYEVFYLLAHDMNTLTHRIFPPAAKYDSMFETLVDDEVDKVVVMRYPMRVKGFRLSLVNEFSDAHMISAFALWSEV